MSDHSSHPDYSLFQPPSLEELAEYLPQYEMKDFLAQGGMGAVYLARQLSLDRLVAIKVLPPAWGAERGYAQRFQTEAKAMAKLRHNHVVGVYDFGITTAGHLYLVMEYVEGETLHDMIRLRRLQPQKVQALALQFCEAIEYAHAHGILHRDLKPGNAMVDSRGQLKVMDFGLARRAEASVEEESLGTPEYTAPEVLIEGALIDHRADIFSLGIVFQQMLTSREPDRVRQPLSNFGSFDPGWEALIDKATATDPGARFQNMSELREAVAQVGKGAKPAPAARGAAAPGGGGSRRPGAPVPHRPQPHPPGHPSSSGRSGSPVPWMPIGVVLVLLGIGAAWWMQNRGPAKSGTPAGSGATPTVAADGQGGTAPAVGATPPPDATPPAGGSPTVTPPPPPATGNGGSGGATGPYTLDNVSAGHVFQFQEGHRDRVNDVIILPDQYRAATCSADGTVMIWNLHTGKRERTLGPVQGRLFRVVSSPDGGQLVATGDDYHVHLWDLSLPDSQPTKSEVTKARSASQVLFSADGGTVIIGTSDSDQNLLAWDWRQNRMEVIPGFRGVVTGLENVPGSPKHFIAGSYRRDGTQNVYELWLCDAQRRSLEKELPAPNLVAAKPQLAPDGKTMVTVANGIFLVRDKDTGSQISRMQGPYIDPSEAFFVDNGRLLLVSTSERTVRIFETSTGSEVWKSDRMDTRGTNFAAVSADEKFFVTAGGFNPYGSEKDGDYALHVWKMPDLATLKTDGAAVAVARQEAGNLQTSDPELWTLLGELAKEWDEAVVKAAPARRKQLDDRYLTALRRDVGAASPREKEPFLGEISRVSNGEAVPSQRPADWPPALVTLYEYYLVQLAKLAEEDLAARGTVVKAQKAKLDALEAQRTAQNNAGGAERVRMVKSAIASADGEVVVDRIMEIIRARPPASGSSPSTSVTSPLPPAPRMRGPSRLTRPTQTGSVVSWRRAPNATISPSVEWPETRSTINDAVAVSGGSNHVLILRADGTVAVMGMKSPGVRAVVPSGLDKVVMVAAGSRYDFALREDGSTVVWSSQSVPSTEGVRPAIAIHAGPSWGYARHPDGTVTKIPVGVSNPSSSGADYSEPPPGLGTISSVVIGTAACVALLPDGSLSSWGNGAQGSEVANLPAGRGTEVISIAVNFGEAAALRRNGEFFVWGTSSASYYSSFQPASFPGADRVIRAAPGGAFAIHFPGGRWKIAKALSHNLDTALTESMAQGCFDLALTSSYCVGLKKP